MENLNNYLQLGAVAIVFLFFIREVFAYLKTKKNGNGYEKKIYLEFQKMNENHLNSITKEINTGFDRMVDTMNQNDKQIIALLSEIKGRLTN